MKKHIITTAIMALLCMVPATAQTFTHVWQHGMPTNNAMGEMTYSDNGNTLTIGGQSYLTQQIDSITFGPYIDTERTITVTYQGTTATVDLPTIYQDSIMVQIDGANVVINNTKTGGEEFTLILSGESTQGSLLYDGEYKCTIILAGLSLQSQSMTTAPLDIKCGKRVELRLQENTTNTLEDNAMGDQKACLWCKGHLEIAGSGTLNIRANAKHGIGTKEYLLLKRSCGNINILAAASDALHIGQYMQMNGGSILIDGNTMGDGIQVETLMLDDGVTPDNSKEQNGQLFINGGRIQATITHEDCKAIKADSDITIMGGTLQLDANGNGSRGIQTDGSVTIGEADAAMPTLITINANGARCTLDSCADDPHRCMGMKIDGNLTVTGGKTVVKNNGSKSRGIKVAGTYTKTGGTVEAVIVQ